MVIELPIQSISGIATIAAAIIAGLLTYAGLAIAKEQKTSEFRQAWIEGLRADLGSFFSTIRAFCRAMEERNPNTVLYVKGAEFSGKTVEELRLAVSENFYKIFLRLNSKKETHRELEGMLRSVIKSANNISMSNTPANDALKELDIVAEFSRPVLKTEWERVKAGELRFRVALYGTPVIIISIALLCGILVSCGAVKFTDASLTIVPHSISQNTTNNIPPTSESHLPKPTK